MKHVFTFLLMLLPVVIELFGRNFGDGCVLEAAALVAGVSHSPLGDGRGLQCLL